jgi:inorganic triphosphatase YgiF
MAQEIELKFIVEKDSVETLRQHLNALEAKHTPAGQLLNIYYETPITGCVVMIWGCASAAIAGVTK